MAIGGNGYPDNVLDDVELVSLDPILHPVPDCLTRLNPLPVPTQWASGAVDYTSMLSINICTKPRILETKTRMNGQGRKAIPFQLKPFDKSDPAQMFRGA